MKNNKTTHTPQQLASIEYAHDLAISLDTSRELLEAARGAVNWIEGMGPFICEKASIRAALIGLRAAIAKAEGH
jgi:hypothetical protein